MSSIHAIAFAVLLCHVIFIDQSTARGGFCSTNWFADKSLPGDLYCFDFHDRCKLFGGHCDHDYKSDHGEGCACVFD